MFIRWVGKMGISRVGSKGEIFPPKEIREKLGLHAHTRVLYRVEDGRLIVEPIPSLEEVLKESPLAEVTLEEFHKFRKQLSQKAET
jgi:AbrB family looped-hinge helix DNA binding protein